MEGVWFRIGFRAFKSFQSFKPFKTLGTRNDEQSGEIKREKKNKEGYAGGYTACGAGHAVRRVVSPLLGCRRNGSGAL